MSQPIDRRRFLRGGASALAGLGALGPAGALGGTARPRIGIVGGGLAGVSCGWLLDGVADTVLFESRPVLGGHADTIDVEVDGVEVAVDVGAQFFAPGPHPLYSALLRVLGLLTPESPDDDESIDADMTVTLIDAAQVTPSFVSPGPNRWWPILAPWNRAGLLAFLQFSLASRDFVDDGDWRITLDEWLGSLPVGEEEREAILLPLVSAMVGCPTELARGLSARGAVTFVGAALPDNLLEPIRYGNSLLGLGGNVERLAADAADLTAHVNNPVRAVAPAPNGRYRIFSSNGLAETVDAVIFATPPYVTRPLLAFIPWQWGARSVLGGFEHFHTNIAIHLDPVYMPPLPATWSAYNAEVAGDRCEASVWYGALRPPLPGGERLRLFKSWATGRADAPGELVHERDFRHPLITPGFIRTQRRLALHQGRGDTWFAGSYTQEVDSQDAALQSAIDIVARRFPNAPNLQRLRAELEAANFSGVGPAQLPDFIDSVG